MIPLEYAVMVVVYLLVAAVIFGLLWWLINLVAGLFPGEGTQVFVKVARVVLMVLAILIVIGLLLSLVSGQPLFYRVRV